MKEVFLKNIGFKHFDETVFSDIADEAARGAYIEMVLIAAMMVNAAGPVKAEHADYKFDEASIAGIESYLALRHKHTVVKWGEGVIDIERIVTPSGAKSSNSEKIAEFQTKMNVIGVLFAYCLAKCVDGKITIKDDGSLVMNSAGAGGVFPVGKVFKFLRNGSEDSLVGFLAAVKNKAENDVLRDMVIERIMATLPVDHTVQDWVDDKTGKLLETWVLNADRTVFCVCVYAGEEEAA